MDDEIWPAQSRGNLNAAAYPSLQKQAAALGLGIAEGASKAPGSRMTDMGLETIERTGSALEQALKTLQSVSDRLFGQAPETDGNQMASGPARSGLSGHMLDRLDNNQRLAVLVLQAAARLEQRI